MILEQLFVLGIKIYTLFLDGFYLSKTYLKKMEFLLFFSSIIFTIYSCSEGTDTRVSLHISELKPIPEKQQKPKGNLEISGSILAMNDNLDSFSYTPTGVPKGYRLVDAEIWAFDKSGNAYNTISNNGRFYLNSLPSDVCSMTIIPSEKGLKFRSGIITPFCNEGDNSKNLAVNSRFNQIYNQYSDASNENILYLSTDNNLLLTVSGLEVIKDNGDDKLKLFPSVVYEKENFQVLGLRKDNFIVHIDGEAKDFFFNEGKNSIDIVPYIAMVIDVSGSMSGEKIELVRKAANIFVENVSSFSYISIITFADSATVLTDFTNDSALLKEIIGGISAGGSTALRDGLLEAINAFKEINKKGSLDYILLLTDGYENSSTHTEEEVMSGLSDISIPVVIGYTPDADKDQLKKYSNITGGLLLPLEDNSIQRAILGLVTQLENPYFLLIPLNGLPDGQHIVGIKVVISDGLEATWCGGFVK